MNDELSAIGLTSKVKAGAIASGVVLLLVVAALLIIPDRIPDSLEASLWNAVGLALLAAIASFGAQWGTAEKAGNFEETKRL